MPRALNEASLRHLATLFGGGSGLGMSDGQLLERFVARDGPRSERAFGVLVERHGPMVQRVARAIAGDRDLADDAFQAVFVALAKRSRALWVRESIGPWLHAVTVRVATRMRADQARRRRLDERAARLAPASYEPGIPDDLGAALHEEIARLPESQRLPIVLCLVEGLTHDQAARRLGWPVGTVRSRLARGRERLRSRLDRRGLAPSSGLLIGPGLLVRSGSEAIRGSLISATVRDAVSATQGGVIGLVGTVPAGAIAAAVTLVKESSMIQRILAVGLMSAGVFAVGASLPAQSGQESNSVAESPQPARPIYGSYTMVSRVYNVPDLVVGRPSETILGIRDGSLVKTVINRPGSMSPLIDLLTSTIAPGTWQIGPSAGDPSDAGSPRSGPGPIGSISPVTDQFSLAIRHTPEVHDEVVERLGQLRLIVGPLTSAPDDGVVEQRVIGPELTDAENEFTEIRIIGPEPTDVEEVEERVAGPQREVGPAQETTTVPREVQQPSSYTVIREVRPKSPSEGSGQPAEPPAPEEAQPSTSPPPSTAQDDRIESLERKLDAILEELRAIRGGEEPEGVQGGDDSD